MIICDELTACMTFRWQLTECLHWLKLLLLHHAGQILYPKSASGAEQWLHSRSNAQTVHEGALDVVHTC